MITKIKNQHTSPEWLFSKFKNFKYSPIQSLKELYFIIFIQQIIKSLLPPHWIFLNRELSC